MKKLSMILIVIILSIAHGCATVDLEWYHQGGQQARDSGDYQKATEQWEAGLVKARARHDKRYIMTFLRDLADIYREQFRFQEALEMYEELVMLARELQFPAQEAYALRRLGSWYKEQEEYQKALELYKQSLALVRPFGNFYEEGWILMEMSEAYADLGQHFKAKEMAEQALALASKVKDSELRVDLKESVLRQLGYVYNHLRQPQEAIECFKKAASVSRQGAHHTDVARALRGLGNVYSWNRRPEEATEAWEQALVLFRKYHHNLFAPMKVLPDLGKAYWRLRKYQRAVESYEEAVEIIEAVRVGFTTQEQIAYLQRYMNVYDELLEVFQFLHKVDPDKGYDSNALEIFERKQGRLFLNEMGKSGARRFAGVPDALLQQMFNVENQLEDTHAQVVAERSRPPEEAHFKLTARSFENLRGEGMPEQVVERLQPLENTAFTKEELVVAAESTIGQEHTETYKELILKHVTDLLSELEEQENTLKAEQTALQKQLKTDYPDYYALQYPQPVSLEELQQYILQPGELLLVYAVMEDNTILLVVSQDTLQMSTVFLTEKMLQRYVNALRKALRSEYEKTRGLPTIVKDSDLPKKSFVELSHALYTHLIPEEIRPLLTEAQTLTIVPTGPLYALPFEALVTQPTPDPSQEGNDQAVHYLVEDIPISYLSSASLLKILREAEARRTVKPPYPLLAFADPVYGEIPLGPPLGKGREISPAPSQEGSEEQALRTQAYRAFFEEGFTELPETAEEAEAIATLLNAPQESEPLQLREQASRSNIFAFHDTGRLDEYRYLVFATHGVLPGEIDQITQPALVLSYPEQEGYLTMADVFQLKCNADLISLSACNTGMGEQRPNEGVIGLTRSFMYAGTSAVTVTLWSVESKSAKELDVGLFEHLVAGESPAQALRAAKLSLLRGEKGDRYRHPYYWAPFVLFGDGL